MAEREVVAPLTGTVVSIDAPVGSQVAAGQAVLVLESMKMEHVVPAPGPGVLAELRVSVGDTVAEGAVLAVLAPAATGEPSGGAADGRGGLDLDAIRPDLAEVIERHRAGTDAARPEAVARRRALGYRTARENVADLCDPGTFTEYGALVLAAQRRRRTLDDLIARTPADGLVAGIGEIGGRRAVVMAYDYTVLAGTQGVHNHRKQTRVLELALRHRLPVVLFAEGGGGRPGDTDTWAVASLDEPTFHAYARLSGVVPLVAIVNGRCFAGNAALAGCSDIIIAAEGANLGMGGPAMIEGGGLGVVTPGQVGPMSVQVPDGVVDVLVADEAAAVAVAKQYLALTSGECQSADWTCADQRELRHVIPQNRVRGYDVRRVVDLVADTGSLLELRAGHAAGVITALARVQGRPVGLVANNPAHLGGAIDSPAAEKLARFLQLCEAHQVPVVSLVDTPGFMVGVDAEATAAVRRFSRLFVTGAALSVPVVAVVLRKAYGLGAMAMTGGHLRLPLATVAWPGGEFGGMGLEGAVRLGYRDELAAIEDEAQRARRYDELVAGLYERGKAVSTATVFEIDDVIDPAGTRSVIAATLASWTRPDQPRPARFIDTW